MAITEGREKDRIPQIDDQIYQSYNEDRYEVMIRHEQLIHSTAMKDYLSPPAQPSSPAHV